MVGKRMCEWETFPQAKYKQKRCNCQLACEGSFVEWRKWKGNTNVEPDHHFTDALEAKMNLVATPDSVGRAELDTL
jgi:hypothetical protein